MKTTNRVRVGVDRRRRGTILIWFAVLLFALLPLMALVVHLGMATLSRRQMQTAVNSAALEGLRFENDRAKVQTLVSAIYDDNLDLAADEMQFGAGPVIVFDDEPTDVVIPDTDFRGSRRIRRENIGVHDPTIQLNASNQRHGDMVAGQYQPLAAHRDDVNGEPYVRTDFLLDTDDAYNADVGDDAFLVRLRRLLEKRRQPVESSWVAASDHSFGLGSKTLSRSRVTVRRRLICRRLSVVERRYSWRATALED